MTMPSSGTIDLQDAALEFFGSTSGGTGGLNASAGSSGFLRSTGTSALGVSQRNGLNVVVPTAAPISVQSLYGASGANMLGYSLLTGSGTGGSFGVGTVSTTGNTNGTTYNALVSIPTGLTISSVTPVTFARSFGAGTATIGTWASAGPANQWQATVTLTSVTAGTTNYDLVVDISDGSRTRRMSILIGFQT